MIVELCRDRTKPRRGGFIRLQTFLLLCLMNPNKLVWLRSFPSLDERDRMKAAFYEGEFWKNELEAIAMPMIDSYDVILCETSPGYVFDGPREGS